MDGAGNFVVAWESYEQDGSYSGVFGQRFDAAGSKIGIEFQVNSTTADRQKYPGVTADSAGNFVVVWQSLDRSRDRSSWGVFGQRFDSGGNPAGGEFQINSHTTNAQWVPFVAADRAGNFVATWSSEAQDGSAWGVFGQRFDPAGNRIGREFQVNSYTTNYQELGAVAIDDDGTFLVAWQSHSGQDGADGPGVFAQRFALAGGPVGSEFQVNTYTTSSQFGPRLAAGSSGHFVAAWASSLGDGSEAGVFGQRLETPVLTCAADGDTLCLHHNRFRAEIHWTNYAGDTGIGQAVPFTGDSGLFWFFGPGNLEMLIKVVDGCELNQRYWVYAGATTDVEYRLTVTDTWTDSAREYTNPLGHRAPAITDSGAFATCGAIPGEARTTTTAAAPAAFHALPKATPALDREIASPLGETDCIPGDHDLCLGNNRFRVRIDWSDYAGRSGAGWAVPYTERSGMFWFFAGANIELLVKVIDACGVNSRFWVYAAATTDVRYTMTVTDTLRDVSKTYDNPLGTASPAITDSSAFATCN